MNKLFLFLELPYGKHFLLHTLTGTRLLVKINDWQAVPVDKSLWDTPQEVNPGVLVFA